MNSVENVSSLQAQLKPWRQAHQSIAFVPTMGNLHAGHMSLLKKAHTLADKVVVSIFVNPLQFDDAQDLANYPRTLKNDIQLLSSNGCDLLFTPSVEVMYPRGKHLHTLVHVPGMDDKLCGKTRPGHFDGVATVVTKLFNMVQPDLAVFGEKDYQQLLLVKKLVQDINLHVEIMSEPTTREADGLAMSSRNQRLSEAERKQSAQLYHYLKQIKQNLEQGERNFDQLSNHACVQLDAAGLIPEYVEIRRASDLEPADPSRDNALCILAAVRVGQVRLIDNVAVTLPEKA